MPLPLSSTHDLFFLVASLACGWVTIFLCWALYELARLLRESHAVLEQTRGTVDRVDRVVRSALDTVEDSASYVGYVTEGAKQIFSLFRGRNGSSARTNKKRKRIEEDEAEGIE